MEDKRKGLFGRPPATSELTNKSFLGHVPGTSGSPDKGSTGLSIFNSRTSLTSPLASKPLTSNVSAVRQAAVSSFHHAKDEEDQINNRKGICFVIDCTGSRSETWTEAQKITAGLFDVLKDSQVQVVIHRNNDVENLGRFNNASAAKSAMSEIDCVPGQTNIVPSLEVVLNGAKNELPATIYMIGDCFEESGRDLRRVAARLKENNIPVRAFHEGDDKNGESAYKLIAELTGGTFSKFGPGCAASLKEMCEAAATLDVSGRAKFERMLASGHAGARALQNARQALAYKPDAIPDLGR
jgi:hypothetical protein